MLEPFAANFVDNPIVVQFVHRWLAFAVLALVMLQALKAAEARLTLSATAMVAAVMAQILLGILTLVSGVELWIAVAHQAMAALLLASVVATAHGIGARSARPA
jgi:cytochrome c oxidase assembly protein subunit 15